MPGLANTVTDAFSSTGEPFGEGIVASSSVTFAAAESGWLAYTHDEFLLVHREHRGIRRSQANLDLAQASQDRRSVLRIV